MYAIESEKVIIGILLKSERAREKWLDKLRAEWFADMTNRLIFRQVAMMHVAKKPVDAILVGDSLENNEAAAYCVTLVNRLEPYWEVPGHFDRLRSAFLARESSEVIRSLTMDAEDPAALTASLSGALERIESIQSGEDGGLVGIDTCAREWIEACESFQNDAPRIKFGLTDLDRRIGSLMPGDFCVIAGRPASGKTSLLTQCIEANPDVPIAFFSLEMTRPQVIDRMITQMTGQSAPMHELRYGRQATEEQWMAATRTLTELKNRKIFIDDTPGISIGELELRARSKVRREGVGLVCVDYLQLVTCKAESRFMEVSEVSRRLLGLAKSCKVPVVAVSQLRRQPTGSAPKPPTMADLRESGQIEQDATQIGLIYRDPDQDKPAQINWDKNRWGENGVDYYRWLGTRQVFQNLENYRPPKQESYNPYRRSQ